MACQWHSTEKTFVEAPILELLLQKNADINIQQNVCMRLCEREENINSPLYSQHTAETAIMHACKKTAMMKILIERAGPALDVNKQNQVLLHSLYYIYIYYFIFIKLN